MLPPNQIRVGTYNVRLWSTTFKGTVLDCMEQERTTLIHGGLVKLQQQQVEYDALALHEDWRHQLTQRLVTPGSHSSLLAYRAVGGKCGEGLSAIKQVLRDNDSLLQYAVELFASPLIKKFAKSDFPEDPQMVESFLESFLYFLKENTVVPVFADIEKRLINKMHGLGISNFMGCGGSLLYRHYGKEDVKANAHSYLPEVKRHFKGLEKYADKGIDVVWDSELKPGIRVSLFRAHLHVGRDADSIRARKEQLKALRKLMDMAPYPVILLTDANIDADWVDPKTKLHEYQEMLKILNLKDAYREVYPDASKHPGHTYYDDLLYQKRLGIQSKRKQRLDFILVDHRFKVVSADIRQEPFYNPAFLYRHFSDHLLKEAVLETTPEGSK